MPGGVNENKRDARWTRMTERAVQLPLVGSSSTGVDASAMVVLVGAGWERLADLERAVDQPTRVESGDCFAQFGLGLRRRTEKGYFGNFTSISPW